MPKVTRKGQVTIPKKVRDSLGLRPGNEVDFRMEEGVYFLEKKTQTTAISKWAGFLKGNRISDEIIEELRGKAR